MRQEPCVRYVKCGRIPPFWLPDARLRKSDAYSLTPFRGRYEPSSQPLARVQADRAYSCRTNHRYLRRRGIKATLPSKADQDINRRKPRRRFLSDRFGRWGSAPQIRHCTRMAARSRVASTST